MDLEEQLQEFESIQSIYDSDKLSFDQNLINKLQSIVESTDTNNKQNDLPNLTFTLLITTEILIHCTLSSTYPSKTAPILFIRSTSSKYSKSSIEDANNLLKSRINQQFEPGNPLLFDLFDWIQENIPSVITVANFNINTSKTMTIKKLNLQRSFMWFHHIYSTTKKRNINQLARQYKLTGFCVTGKPGVIVAEGIDKNVNQYIADLKSWNWQRMIVRQTDIEICDDIKQFEERQKYKKWTFNNIPPHTKGGMKDVYELLKDGNLESYYKMIVHINTPMDCKLNGDKKDEQKGNDKNNDNDDGDNGYIEYKKKNKKKWNKYKNDGNGKDMKEIKELGYLRESKNGILLNIKAKPNAKETRIDGSFDNYLEVRIMAEPMDGAANKELCRFIAKIVGCNKRNVSIIKGHKSRDKCVLIQNMNLKDVTDKILNVI